MLQYAPDFADLLAREPVKNAMDKVADIMRRHARTSRPLGGVSLLCASKLYLLDMMDFLPGWASIDILDDDVTKEKTNGNQSQAYVRIGR